VQRAFAEIALPVLDMHYYKLNYQHQWFHPLTTDLTLMLNGEAGVAGGYRNKPLPFFKNFYAGGVGSVRGYDSSSLGPRDVNDLVLGGTKRVVGNAEVLMPVPGVSGKSMRFSGFVDAGAIYGSGDKPGSAGMKYSTGVAFTWISPMGPLKFSYAVPIRREPVDKIQKLQFSMGSAF
jgi:outer membrane protein insertion porin family